MIADIVNYSFRQEVSASVFIGKNEKGEVYMRIEKHATHDSFATYVLLDSNDMNAVHMAILDYNKSQIIEP